MEQKVKSWWNSQVYDLNKTLIEIIGNNLGYVPLENLLNVPSEFGMTELFCLEEILNNEGLKTRWNEGVLEIYVK